MTETFEPFNYQIPMIEHLLANDRAALFVSPGKGKTVVTLTALDTLAKSKDPTAKLAAIEAKLELAEENRSFV
jgi:superfamily II DNA or RNA helicase